MDWSFFAMGTLSAFLATLLFWKVTEFTEKRRRKAKPLPTYDELKRDRDARGYAIYFSVLWVQLVFMREELLSLLDKWTGVIFALCVVAVYVVIRFLMKHSKPSAQERAQPH